jgi:hypothetical protein
VTPAWLTRVLRRAPGVTVGRVAVGVSCNDGAGAPAGGLRGGRLPESFFWKLAPRDLTALRALVGLGRTEVDFHCTAARAAAHPCGCRTPRRLVLLLEDL